MVPPRRSSAHSGSPFGAAAFAALLSALVSGCSSPSPDPFVRKPFVDAGPADGGAEAGSIILDDGGRIDPTLGAPCIDDGQCDDKIACTFDTCDHAVPGGADGGLGRCRHTADDSQCGDGVFCNGRERCVLGVGCAPGPTETCQDQDSCTVDTCVEATQSCVHAPRDLDGDGDPDDHCVKSHDCDDSDPTVASTRAEICGNAKDDNCNGKVDEAPCSTPQADTCGSGLTVTAPGTYALTTVAAHDDVTLSCADPAKDVIANVTIPAGGPKDLDLWLTNPLGVVVALGVQSTCGAAGTELGCRQGQSAVRVRARNLSPGTYAVVAKAASEIPLELAVDFLDPTTPAANETCATAAPLTIGTPVAVSLVDPKKDVPTECAGASGELTYRFTLPAAADLRAFVNVLRGAAIPVLSLRSAACTALTDEIRCRADNSLPLFARNLPAGDYVLTVGASQAIDASVLVTTSAPTTATADETCATAPALTPNVPSGVNLDAHDDDIADGCFPGNPDAALALTTVAPADVLLVARLPPGDTGALSLDGAACTPAASLACTVASSPIRARARNLPVGDYRVVLSDRTGRLGAVTAFARPTVAPVDVTASDVCGANVVSVPLGGGFFVGDTTNAADDVKNGCDQAGAPANGDVILRMDLPQQTHVVFDMQGSTYTTILSVREGALCPGLEATNQCYVGFEAARSFLDRVLPAGTYWVVVDGFNGERGHFELDVRMLPP